jgi:hypothetical protein
VTYSWLPELLAEIAEAAGLDAALKLAESHGGVRRHIPAQIRNNEHWLVQCVGREAADKICAFYRHGSASGRLGGAYVMVPQGPAGTIASGRRRLAKALDDGKSAAEAARAAGFSERSAFRMRARRKDDKQGSLF